jgi:hypothetical protein
MERHRGDVVVIALCAETDPTTDVVAGSTRAFRL